jgi:hypothetical protein
LYSRFKYQSVPFGRDLRVMLLNTRCVESMTPVMAWFKKTSRPVWSRRACHAINDPCV